MTNFLDLDALKRQLGSNTPINDDDLTMYSEVACEVVEDWVGPVAQTAITDEFVEIAGRTVFNEVTAAAPRSFVLRHSPVISLDAVSSPLISGITYDVATFRVEASTGIVRRADNGSIFGPLSVNYTAGYATPPSWATLAATIIAQHLWRTRQGPATARNSAADQVPAGYAIPHQAVALLEPHRMIAVG